MRSIQTKKLVEARENSVKFKEELLERLADLNKKRDDLLTRLASLDKQIHGFDTKIADLANPDPGTAEKKSCLPGQCETKTFSHGDMIRRTCQKCGKTDYERAGGGRKRRKTKTKKMRKKRGRRKKTRKHK